MLAGHLVVRLDQRHGGNAPHAHNDLGPDERHLVAQVAHAGGDLLLLRVAVLRRAALYYIGYVDIAAAVQVDVVQHFIHQLAAAPHKGLSLLVLVLARPLPDEHDLCLGVAHPKDHMVPALAQLAGGAVQRGISQAFPVHHGCRLLL